MSQSLRLFPALGDVPGMRATTLLDLRRALVSPDGPIPSAPDLAAALEDLGYHPGFVQHFYALPDAAQLAEALLAASRERPSHQLWYTLRRRCLATFHSALQAIYPPGGSMNVSQTLPASAAVSCPAGSPLRVPPKSFAVYYGHHNLKKLSAYRTVVLQPQHYTPTEVQWLRAQGVKVLAYMSVGEDPSPERSPWSRRTRNAEWGTWYVKIGHAGWTAHLHASAEDYLKHFDGLLLDTLDGATLFPSDRSPLLRTLRGLRQRHPHAYFLANRGFELLPEMGQYVDGVLLESFTTSWTDGYRKLLPNELNFTGEMLRRVRLSKLDVYALDYACTPEQRRAAQVRARAQGLSTFISVRELNAI